MRMPNNEVQKRCYELYQLDWMKAHGYSLQDIIEVLKEGASILAEDDDLDMDMRIAFNQMEDYFYENGFNGEMFACYEEFLENEFCDLNYMVNLLKGTSLIKELNGNIKIGKKQKRR